MAVNETAFVLGAALGCLGGLLAGLGIGRESVFRKWRKSKQIGPNGCIHNVVSEREFPKGDRIVCEDCGESDPSFEKPEAA